MKGEFEKRMTEGKLQKEALSKNDIESLIMSRWKEKFVPLEIVEEAKKEFPFASWFKEDLEELKMTIKWSIKERGHSVLDDEVSEEFIKTLDAIEKWFGAK